MPAQLAREALDAKAPLEHFEIWLGDEDYGGSTTIADLSDVLAGNLFPELRVLGLCNCSFADEVAEALATSPVLDRIEKLDLSGGTLTDRGAKALIAGGKLGRLSVDISHHYVSEVVTEELRRAASDLVASDRLEPDKWGGGEHYYVAVSE